MLGSMEYNMGLGGAISLVGSIGKTPKAPAILRHLKPDNCQFWTALYRAKISKRQLQRGIMKDC